MILRVAYYSLFIFMVACSSTKHLGKKDELKIMSYNIHHANPPSRPNFIDVDAIAKTINNQNPDIVALQEVDVNTKRSGLNEASALAEKTKMNLYFAKAIDHDGGDYGVAILSRYPLSNGTTHKLPTAAGTNGEPRVLATANITVNGKTITIACTHLDAQRSDTNRLLQINAIVDILQRENKPVILAGDLNAEPGTAVIDLLDKHLLRTCTQNCGFTIPVELPRKTIDFIAFKPTENFTVVSHQVIDEKYASDHLPVIAMLRLR